MDTRNGRIYSPQQFEAAPPDVKANAIPMALPPTTLQRARRRVGRNDPCPCGSGRKFKKCHLQHRSYQ